MGEPRIFQVCCLSNASLFPILTWFSGFGIVLTTISMGSPFATERSGNSLESVGPCGYKYVTTAQAVPASDYYCNVPIEYSFIIHTGE